MEKKLYEAPETSVMVLKDSLCETFGVNSASTQSQWSKDQDMDDEDFDESPWEE